MTKEFEINDILNAVESISKMSKKKHKISSKKDYFKEDKALILNKQANAIVSKFPLTKTKYHLFHEGTKRVVIESTIKCPKKVTLLLAHLALGPETRKKQFDELITIVNSIKNPVILMGDFNTFGGTKEIQGLLKKTHLKDKYQLDKHSIRMTQPTWHPSRRLDYVLVSPQINVKNYEVLNYPYSDHKPLFVEFNLK